LFPGSQFAALGLVKSGLEGSANILLFVAISILSLIFLLFIGEKLYFKGVLGMSESSSKSVKFDNQHFNRNTNRSSNVSSYAIKEFKILFRTPSFFINCILVNFLWPIFILLPILTSSGDENLLNSIRELTLNGGHLGIVLSIGFAIIVFITASNGITASAVSREGQNFFVNKYIPMNYHTQLIAKVLPGAIISAAAMVLVTATLFFIVQFPVYMIFLMLLAGIPGIIFSSFAGILLDLYNPRLHWDSEHKAVKQNPNLILNMLINVVFAGLTVFAVFKFQMGLAVVLLGIIGIFGVLDWILYEILVKKGSQLMDNITV